MAQKLTIRSGKSSIRRDEIIEIATKVFASKGYHATSLDDIAKQLGITRPSLYNHIKSKGEIIREISNKAKQPLAEMIRIKKSNLHPRGKMRKIIKLLIEFNTGRKELAAIHFEQMNVLPQKTQAAILRRQKDGAQAVQEILKEGVVQDEFAIDHVTMTSLAILGTCNWVYRWYNPEGELTPQQITKNMIAMLEKVYIKSK